MFQMQRSRKLSQIGIGLIIALMALVAFGQTTQTSDTRQLLAGQTVERELTGGQTHVYLVKLKANKFLQVRVEQKGVDVEVLFFAPDGKQLAKVDSPNGTQGYEPLSLIAEAAGAYRLEVRSLEKDAPAGHYEIKIEELRTATAQDRKRLAEEAASRLAAEQALAASRLAAEQALAAHLEALRLSKIGTSESLRAAIKKLEETLQLWRAAGDREQEAGVLRLLGVFSNNIDDRQTALNYLNQASKLYHSLGNIRGEADTLNYIGNVYLSQGESQKARDFYKQALPIYLSLGKSGDDAILLVATAGLYKELGEYQKALELLNQAVTLFRAEKERLSEALALQSIGLVYDQLNERRKAIEYYNEAMLAYRALGRRGNEASLLAAIGGEYNGLDEQQKAIDTLNQALQLYRELGDKQNEAFMLIAIGASYDKLGEWQKAIELYNQALPVFRAVGDDSLVSITLNNIGNIYSSLGDDRKALDYVMQSLELLRKIGQRRGQAAKLNNIGSLYRKLGEKQKALEYFNQALPLVSAEGFRQGEAIILGNIGKTYQELGDLRKALEFLNQSLEIARDIDIRREGAFTLADLGLVYSALGEKQKAIDFFNQSLTLHRAVNNPEGEGRTLNNLMTTWKSLDSPRLAVFYGKQAVNTYQQIRENIRGLDKESQRSFLTSKEDTYRKLVEILISQGRLPEAEQVLEMLKEEEYFQFVRRDDKVAKDLLTRISLSPAEKDALERYDKIADEITKFGDEYAKLEEQRIKLPAEQTASIVAQQNVLNKKLEDARKTLQIFLEELKKEFSREDKRIASVEEGLQAAVKGWNEPNTVVISTIVGENSLSIIVTTADVQRAHIVDKIGSEPFSEERLNKLVSEFRAAVIDPRSDARLAGQKLYDVLVKPLEKDLNGVKAKTLVWSLDGNLRYAPIPALWDKNKGYLAQNYANVIITLASRDNLTLQANGKNNLQALGVGVSKSVAGFSPLENVPEELKAIVNDHSNSKVPNTAKESGVLSGRRLLDEQFTYDAFRNQLGRFPVVHAATHFKFVPGTRDEALNSFLLLGNGEKLTLAQIQNAGTIFSGVQLLTLSACETAYGGKDADGREIEGFGAMAQKKGAKAVMATLWAVADESTRKFMVEFYRLYQKPGITKAEAMRQAQLAMIGGRLKPTMKEDQKRAELVGGGQSANGKPFVFDRAKPFAHPYYWSPFVLIGNWR